MSSSRLIANHYHQNSTRGATPIGLIITQFDQILRDLRRAVAALDSGDVESRTAHINHALLVIAQLQNVLDHARGGEAASRFEQFYNGTRPMLIQAQFAASREILQQCMDMYLALRQAWHQAEATLHKNTATTSQDRATPPVQPIAPVGPSASGSKWDA